MPAAWPPPGNPVRSRTGLERAADQLCALEQPDPGAAVGHANVSPVFGRVVAHSQSHPVGAEAQSDQDGGAGAPFRTFVSDSLQDALEGAHDHRRGQVGPAVKFQPHPTPTGSNSSSNSWKCGIAA